MEDRREVHEEQAASTKKRTGTVVALSILAGLLVIGIGVILGYRAYITNEYRRYQLNYPEAIQAYSGEYDLDPYLVAAIINVESGNRVDAESGVGAKGLMQIMPDTGEWIAQKLGESYSVDMLLQPDINIRFGCWYLRFLADRFPERDTILAAYNAGHGRVNGWLDDKAISADGRLLDNIPYPETHRYVEKVLHNYERYHALYPDAFAHGAE